MDAGRPQFLAVGWRLHFLTSWAPPWASWEPSWHGSCLFPGQLVQESAQESRKLKLQSFYDLILEATHHHFRHMPLVTQTNLGTMWEGTTKGCDHPELWRLPTTVNSAKALYAGISPTHLCMGTYPMSAGAFLRKAPDLSSQKPRYPTPGVRNSTNVFDCSKSVKQVI